MTPCRLSACSMLSSVEATLVGGLLPLFSQYRTDRGWHPAARARSACVSPASIRAARIWRPETMLLITRLYIRFWKRRHRPPCFILSDGHLLVRRTAIPAAPMPLPRWCDFAERTLWNVRRGPALLRLDVGRPDDRPPLIDLRLVVGIERLRRLLFARRKLHADVPEAPLRGGVGEGGRDRGVESGDDRLGRALGRPHPVPERKVH